MPTWYVMEDGSCCDPADIAPDDNGILRHSDGRAVAYAPHGPRSRSVEPEGEPQRKTAASREMRPEKPKPAYKTRGMKA